MAVRDSASCSTKRFALAGLALTAGLLCHTAQAQAPAAASPTLAGADTLHAQVETRAKAVEKQLIAWRRDIHRDSQAERQPQRPDHHQSRVLDGAGLGWPRGGPQGERNHKRRRDGTAPCRDERTAN